MKLRTALQFLIIALLAVSMAASSSAQSEYDVLIKGGKIIDGSGSKEFRGDVAIKDGKIVKVAKSVKGSADKVINAKGMHVMPGFIDLHSHANWGMYIPEQSSSLNYLKQGVTSTVVGQCGSSAWPIFEEAKDQMDRWENDGIGMNVSMLVGHGSVRRIAMGTENREPTPDELEHMKQLVKTAMEQGAAGLSTGLIYRPGTYAKTDEVIEIVKVIAPFDGIYHTHIRNENVNLLEAVKEAIHICETTGARTNISHFKVMNEENWGSVKEACRLIEEAQARGLKITADQYPYRYSNTSPYSDLIPRRIWIGDNEDKVLSNADIEAVFEHLRDNQLIDLYNKVSVDPLISDMTDEYLESMPRKQLVSVVAGEIVSVNSHRGPANQRERKLFLERLNDPEEGKKIRQQIKVYLESRAPMENYMVAVCPVRKYEDKPLTEAAEIMGKSIVDTAIELTLMGSLFVPYRMDEADMEFIMKKDWVATGSDGAGPAYGIGEMHPRAYSTFLHKIKKYVQDRKAVTLPHVIRSQTSLPAKIMNWNDRGMIKEGYKADVNVIDVKKIKTESSITTPHNYSEGVNFLLINGEVVIDKGEYTGKLPGEVLKLKKTAIYE